MITGGQGEALIIDLTPVMATKDRFTIEEGDEKVVGSQEKSGRSFRLGRKAP